MHGSTAIINNANLDADIFDQLHEAVRLESLNDITISLLTKNNIQAIIVTHRGLVTNRFTFLLSQMKRVYPYLTVVLIANNIDIRDNLKLMKAGVDHILAYGKDPNRLAQSISNILKKKDSSELTAGNLVLNPSKRLVKRAGIKIDLRKKEFELLKFLLENVGRIFSRMELLDTIWGYSQAAFSNTVDVHVSSLRKKIDKGFGYPLIHTAHGAGYKIDVMP